jgi:hypothetical protein
MLTKDKLLHCCRICGLYYDDYYPWGDDGDLPSFDICLCCGAEFGFNDYSEDEKIKYRIKWLRNMKNGGKWDEEEYRPKDWDIKEQLENIVSSEEIEQLFEQCLSDNEFREVTSTHNIERIMRKRNKTDKSGEFNYHRKVSELLSQLPKSAQTELVLCFVRHAFLLSDNDPLQDFFNVITQYIDGHVSIFKVKEEWYRLAEWRRIKDHESGRYDALMKNLSIIPPNKPIVVPITFSKYLQEKYDLIIQQVYPYCCYDELWTKDLIHTNLKCRAKVSHISRSSCYIKSLGEVGKDWDSPEPSIRQTARKRGHEISQQEAIWQIQQIEDKLKTLKEP